MPKIVDVKVWGFESHIASEYTLDPGLTVITGASDSGKTSGTLRAIRWLAEGQPSGEDFLHTIRNEAGEIIHQAEEAGVEVTLDNGVVIKKTRRKGKTKYWVTGYDEPFEKAEVPEAVKEALGIRSTVYGRDAQGKPELEVHLNFAYQLDTPFLLSQPGSAGAKVLGKLAGTESIDQALKSVAKDTYAARSEKAAADKEYERKVMQALDYQDLDDIKAQIDAAEWLAEQIDKDLAKQSDLLSLRMQLDRATNQLAEAAATLDRLTDVPSLEEDLKEIEKVQQRYDTLLDLYGQLARATATVENLTRQMKDYEGIEPAEWLLQQVEATADKQSSIILLAESYHKHEAAVKTSNEVLMKTAGIDQAAELLPAIELSLERYNKLDDIKVTYEVVSDLHTAAASNMDYLAGLDPAADSLTNLVSDHERLIPLKEIRAAFLIKEQTRDKAQQDYNRAADEIRLAELELAAAWDDAGGICPLCEQPTATHVH
ncbi:AAA family ATPase [Paenibacillus sp. BK720]|uniref:AAA family ATPase n=1 Tax=Paenibacillus sp. BK720 TaxID=2587092 RepID=UPI00141DFA80|nr:AAA family ATPase [Paenibacillus sp. BK720]NIK67898.1 exonuclease SbcC [Paenibacillus sp. BK720]